MCVPRWYVRDHLGAMQRMWCWLSSPWHISEILFGWRHQASFWTGLLYPLAFTSCNVLGICDSVLLTSASKNTCCCSLFCSNSSKDALCIELPLSFTELFCVSRTRHMPSSLTNAHAPTLIPELRGLPCNFLVAQECAALDIVLQKLERIQ